MNDPAECSARYLGYPFSLDFVSKLGDFFNLYYCNLFSKIAPVWLKHVSSASPGGEPRAAGASRFEVEDIEYERYRDLYRRGLDESTLRGTFAELLDAHIAELLDRKLDSNSFEKAKTALSKVDVAVAPCLLAVYRTDIYRSFLVFPFLCKTSENLTLSNELVAFLRSISTVKTVPRWPESACSETEETEQRELKVGFLDRLEKEIDRQSKIKVLISIHFNENTDFTLFELNFNNPLNHLCSSR